VFILFYLNRQHKRREKTGNYPYVDGDIRWTKTEASKFIGISLVTGILAAMFGLGGGTLNSPVMLELGLLPAVVPSTSGLMILITSSIAIIQYFALGSARWDYMLWFAVVGFFGGVSGHLGIRYYVKKYHKQSLIVLLLGIMIFAGFVVLIYNTSILFAQNKAVMAIASPCASS